MAGIGFPGDDEDEDAPLGSPYADYDEADDDDEDDYDEEDDEDEDAEEE